MNILALLILISLCLRADAAWQPYAANFYSAEKKDVAPYVQKISEAYYEMGAFAPGGKPHQISFSYRIAPNARILGMTAVQNYNADNRGMCTRMIALNGPIRYPSHPFYGTPIWFGTLAHEVGHVYQGAGCMNADFMVETGAEIAMYLVMANMANKGDEVAQAGLVFEFRRGVILATMDLLNKANEAGLPPPMTPRELLDQLQLTSKEKDYFNYYVRNPGSLSKGSIYWTDSIQKIINEVFDGDGSFCNLSFGGDPCFDGTILVRFVKGLLN